MLKYLDKQDNFILKGAIIFVKYGLLEPFLRSNMQANINSVKMLILLAHLAVL